MIDGTKWFLQVVSAVLPNFQQPVRERSLVFFDFPFEAFLQRANYDLGHVLSGHLSQSLRPVMSLRVLDIQHLLFLFGHIYFYQ